MAASGSYLGVSVAPEMRQQRAEERLYVPLRMQRKLVANTPRPPPRRRVASRDGPRRRRVETPCSDQDEVRHDEQLTQLLVAQYEQNVALKKRGSANVSHGKARTKRLAAKIHELESSLDDTTQDLQQTEAMLDATEVSLQQERDRCAAVQRDFARYKSQVQQELEEMKHVIHVVRRDNDEMMRGADRGALAHNASGDPVYLSNQSKQAVAMVEEANAALVRTMKELAAERQTVRDLESQVGRLTIMERERDAEREATEAGSPTLLRSPRRKRKQQHPLGVARPPEGGSSWRNKVAPRSLSATGRRSPLEATHRHGSPTTKRSVSAMSASRPAHRSRGMVGGRMDNPSALAAARAAAAALSQSQDECNGLRRSLENVLGCAAVVIMGNTRDAQRATQGAVGQLGSDHLATGMTTVNRLHHKLAALHERGAPVPAEEQCRVLLSSLREDDGQARDDDEFSLPAGNVDLFRLSRENPSLVLELILWSCGVALSPVLADAASNSAQSCQAVEMEATSAVRAAQEESARATSDAREAWARVDRLEVALQKQSALTLSLSHHLGATQPRVNVTLNPPPPAAAPQQAWGQPAQPGKSSEKRLVPGNAVASLTCTPLQGDVRRKRQLLNIRLQVEALCSTSTESVLRQMLLPSVDLIVKRSQVLALATTRANWFIAQGIARHKSCTI